MREIESLKRHIGKNLEFLKSKGYKRGVALNQVMLNHLAVIEATISRSKQKEADLMVSLSKQLKDVSRLKEKVRTYRFFCMLFLDRSLNDLREIEASTPDDILDDYYSALALNEFGRDKMLEYYLESLKKGPRLAYQNILAPLLKSPIRVVL
mgnify:CR=1 FL=1